MRKTQAIIGTFAVALSLWSSPLAQAQSAGRAGDVWAIVVGVPRVDGLDKLDHADDDAILFYRLLQDPLGARAARERVILHLGGDESPDKAQVQTCAPRQVRVGDVMVTAYPATSECIRASLRTVAMRAQPGDRVIVYFSGHGMIGYRKDETDERNQNDAEAPKESLFLATTDLLIEDLSKKPVCVLSGTGLTASELRGEFKKEFDERFANQLVPADSPRFLDVWLFLDTCHAGAAASEAQLRQLTQISERGGEGQRGVVRVNRDESDDANKFFDPKLRFIWVLSSGQFQVSWEDKTRKQGVFTYYLARAIRGAAWEASPYRNLSREGDLLISADLGAYLRLNVNQHTMNLVGEGQLPTAIPDFDTIPGFSFTRAERRFGVSVDVETPDNARVTVQLRSLDGKRAIVAEAPCLFTLAQIDGQLGASDRYLLEIRAPRQRLIRLELPLGMEAPTSVTVDYPFEGAKSLKVNTGGVPLTVEHLGGNLYRAVPANQ